MTYYQILRSPTKVLQEQLAKLEAIKPKLGKLGLPAPIEHEVGCIKRELARRRG